MKMKHGGARKGAGRHPAADKADKPVFIRLTSSQQAKAVAKARRQGHATVAAWLKAWLLGEIGEG